jgi:Protein of unknown function (DUF4446)
VDSDVAGIVAVSAAALALIALLVSLLLSRRLRRLRATLQTVAGPEGERTLVEHASDLERRMGTLGAQVEERIRKLEGTDAEMAGRLRSTISRCTVVRYDAMGEMTGRQSSSIALLDSHGNGVVLSSILHREQARLYAKPVAGGHSELELSPEEQQAISAAMGSAA